MKATDSRQRCRKDGKIQERFRAFAKMRISFFAELKMRFHRRSRKLENRLNWIRRDHRHHRTTSFPLSCVLCVAANESVVAYNLLLLLPINDADDDDVMEKA